MRVDEHTIEVAGSPVFYRSASAPGVPPLYLHGIPTSSDDWTTFLALTGGIAPDLIGFGRSGKAGNLDYSIEGHADFLEGFLEALAIDRVKLVVHDWGAAGGLLFAQRHPERVERIVLCNPAAPVAGFGFNRLGRVWRHRLLGEIVMGSITEWMLARWLRGGCAREDAFSQERVAVVWAQFDQGTQRAILRLHRSTDERQITAAGAGLEKLGMPALVIWGTSDPWLPQQLGEAYAARLEGATLLLVADAGHWPWLDQPDVVGRVAAFLESA